MGHRVFVLLALLLLASSPVLADEVYGRVWVAAKGAAAGATIVFEESGVEKGRATADRDGNFRTELPTKAYVVYVIYADQTSTRVRIQVSGRTKANLELRPRPGGGWLLTKG